jgi:hypothetical protein
MPDQVHQVGGVFAVVNGERRINPYPFGIFPQQARTNGMESPGPYKGVAHERIVACDLTRNSPDPAGHLGSCPSREGHQQDAAGVCALDDEVRDPVGQRVGFSGSGAGDYEKRRPDCAALPYAMFDGEPLRQV